MNRWMEWLIVAGFGALLAWGITSNHYTAKVSELRTTIADADRQARLNKLQGEENAKQLKQENNDNLAALKRYYQRLLQPVPAKAGSGTNATSAQGNDGASSEQSIAGCSAEFQYACLRDANKVEMWREYGERNHVPVQ